MHLIKPENQVVLKADLERRIGLKINRFEIDEISFLRDAAEITIYYDAQSQEAWESGDGTEYDLDEDALICRSAS